jgi:5-methylcytosine-specific restriction endonuclease McrA
MSDILATVLKTTAGKKPEDDMRREIIATLLEVCDISKKVEKFKTRADVQDFLDRCVGNTQKPKLFRQITAVSNMVAEIKDSQTRVKEAEVKRLERQAKKEAREAREAREAKTETSRIQVGAGANVVLNINLNAMAAQVAHQATKQSDKPTKPSKPNKRKGIPKSVRDQSWNRWIGPECGMAPCYCCRENIISKSGFECGHVVPDVFGGKSSVENLRPICLPCNRSMGVSDMRSFCKEFYRDVLDIPYKNKLE